MADKKKMAHRMGRMFDEAGKNKGEGDFHYLKRVTGKRWGNDKDLSYKRPLSKKEKADKRGEDAFELNRGN